MFRRLGFFVLFCSLLGLILTPYVNASTPTSLGQDSFLRPLGISKSSSLNQEKMLVRFRSSSLAAMNRALDRHSDGKIESRYRSVPGLVLVDLPSSENSAEISALLEQDSRVLYAQPEQIFRIESTIPNDTRWDGLWGLRQIRAPQAWDLHTGTDNNLVAVLDTGIDLQHPDLQGNIWSNPAEIPGNEIDDDANGFIDDKRGWNFISNSNDVADGNGHGTHVSGTIAARGNNSLGVVGVNWRAKVMPIKVCSDGGECPESSIIAGLDYAVQNGAKISNNSYGGDCQYWSDADRGAMEDAIKAAGQANHLFVAAAGNSGQNVDQIPHCPSSLDQPNIVSVAANNEYGSLASFSNRGMGVDLAAPGDGILSTIPWGRLGLQDFYGSLSGTSMASPHVAGAAALIHSYYPTWTPSQIKDRLMSSVLFAGSALETSTGGILDLRAALDGSTQNQKVLSVLRSGTGEGSISLDEEPLESAALRLPAGQRVVLRAEPSSGSVFQGWSGDCSGKAKCVLGMNYNSAVKARFQAEVEPGWDVGPVEPPRGVPAIRENSTNRNMWIGESFFQMSVSANGMTRSKTIYNLFPASCDNLQHQSGGVFIEQKRDGRWMPDGVVYPPADSDASDKIGCMNFGQFSKLSKDGNTLVISSPTTFGLNGNGKLFVYHRESNGWQLQGELARPVIAGENIEAAYWRRYQFASGIDVSADGSRVAVAYHYGAMWPAYQSNTVALQFYNRQNGQWSSGEHFTVQRPAGNTINDQARIMLRLSDDGQRAALAANWYALWGPPEANSGNSDALDDGKVYVYKNTSGTWQHSYTIPTYQQDSAGTWYASRPFMSLSWSSNGNQLFAAGQYQSAPQGNPSAYKWGIVLWQENPGGGYSPVDRAQSGDVYNCSLVAEDRRLVCADYFYGAGSNYYQGRMVVIDKSASWRESPVQTVLAEEGLGGDLMGASGGWPPSLGMQKFYNIQGLQPLAVENSGAKIMLPISPDNIYNGQLANDRIGYQFKDQTPLGLAAGVQAQWQQPTHEDEVWDYQLSFSEPVSGFGSGDFQNSGTARGCSFTPLQEQGSTVHVQVSGCGSGTLQPVLKAYSVWGSSSGLLPQGDSASPLVQNITRSSPQAQWTQAASGTVYFYTGKQIQYQIQFDSPVQGLSSDDFENQGTARGCRFDPDLEQGTVFTVTVSQCQSGTLQLTLIADSVKNAQDRSGPDADLVSPMVQTRRELPAPDIAAAYPGVTQQSSQILTWSSPSNLPDGETDFVCKLDGQSWQVCTSPLFLSNQTEEAHFVQIKEQLTSGSGAVLIDGQESQISWRVDQSQPEAAWPQQPSSPSRGDDLIYQLSFSEPVFELDSSDLETLGTSTSCDVSNPVPVQAGKHNLFTVTVAGCREGSFSLRLKANTTSDQAGNRGPGLALVSSQVLIDQTPPVLTWENPSKAHSRDSAWSYGLTFSEATFDLDQSEFGNQGTAQDCLFDLTQQSATRFRLNISGCSDGTLQPALVANAYSDSLGNVYTEPSWGGTLTIDRAGPSPPGMIRPWSLKGIPVGTVSNQAVVKFSFKLAEAGGAAWCQLDQQAPLMCSSRSTYITPAISHGAHVFRVWQQDLAGNQGAPASYRWTVDLKRPVLLRLIIKRKAYRQYRMWGRTSEPARTVCRLDKRIWKNCPSGKKLSLSGKGRHLLETRVQDRAGNWSSTYRRWLNP